MAQKHSAHYTHQQIRKSMKKDDLREGITKLIQYAKGNSENLLISAIILGVIIVLVPLYFKHQASNESRATNLLDRAEYYYQQPVDEDHPQPGQVFKTAVEKYKRSQESYAEVSNVYRTTRAAQLAGLGEANARFMLKDYAGALALLQEGLAKHPKGFFAPTVKERIGNCQENMGKWQEASATYQDLLQQTPNYFNRRAVRLGMARSQFHLGKTAEAKQILKDEAAQDPSSYWAESARQQLALYEQGKL